MECDGWKDRDSGYPDYELLNMENLDINEDVVHQVKASEHQIPEIATSA